MERERKTRGGCFEEEAALPGTQKWENGVRREGELELRESDVRSDFMRDYTRILHSQGYRRQKHKTQVFFAPQNDHICTRMEHIAHVGSVAESIAGSLGLNTELVRAIALGHDIGHAPFGHLGEKILDEISKNAIDERFWHEKNGLRFVDDLELLPDSQNRLRNLNLTYAVRDGIISHCGEVNENCLSPRGEAIDLNAYARPSQFSPYTWEGCVVKLSDKISYLGRDIEDAVCLGLITLADTKPLLKSARRAFGGRVRAVNTTALIHLFVTDLCQNSDLEEGLRFSPEAFSLMREVMNFNYERIYAHPKLLRYGGYAKDVLNGIYEFFAAAYEGKETPEKLKSMKKLYPGEIKAFLDWIETYWELGEKRNKRELQKTVYYVAQDEKAYRRAVIDYISGMSDSYAIRTFENLSTFR